MKPKTLELALEEGKRRLSKQTGYIHLFTEDPSTSFQDSIPILENFLYAYALMRSKTAQNILEGKELIERLLHFEKDGNFPVYLHEFPICRDSQFSSQLLPVIFYLLKDFKEGMGEVLSYKVLNLSEKIIEHLQKEPLSTFSKNRLDAFLGTFTGKEWEPASPAEWGEFCVCSQMNGLPLDRVTALWDSSRGVFVGPCKERWQEGEEPAVTLLDLFMGEVFDAFSARAQVSHPVHLKAPLIQTCEKIEVKKSPFIVLIEEDHRQCFTLYSGDKAKVDSFVIEAKKGSFEIQDKGNDLYEILYAFSEDIPGEVDSTEISLYASEGQTIFIGKEKATAFQSGEVLEVCSESVIVKAVVQTDPSQGQWMGHISKGNRSFQKSKVQHSAYDWKIGWRTLRREEKAFLKISLEVKSKEPIL